MNDDKPSKLGPQTRVTHAGRRGEWTGVEGHPSAVVNPPIWRASTHLYPNTKALKDGPKSNCDGRFFYGRRGSPTQWALCDALTGLEPGAAGTMLYPSGVAALTGAFLAVLRPGDVLLMSDHAYEPTRALGQTLLKDFGVETRFFDPLDPAALEAAFCVSTRAVLLESPGSLTMEMQDIPAACALAKARGVVTIMDNTWAGPLGFTAHEHGIDISVMSLTKHVGGHSDLMMGSVSATEEWYAPLRRMAQITGQVVSPDDASLALRGLRTMAMRLERSAATGLAIAQWLEQRPEVARVFCPMLPGSPGHNIWKRDFTGGCGLMGFAFRGGNTEARNAFIDALTLFGIGYSWGGFESLVTPADPGEIRTASDWPPKGMAETDRLAVRLAVGLEDAADLIADLDQAMAAWRGAAE